MQRRSFISLLIAAWSGMLALWVRKMRPPDVIGTTKCEPVGTNVHITAGTEYAGFMWFADTLDDSQMALVEKHIKDTYGPTAQITYT